MNRSTTPAPARAGVVDLFIDFDRLDPVDFLARLRETS
jgi:hypothetical protein